MSFVYCRDCDWGQDDFWNEGYNPAKSIVGYVKEYGKPRWIGTDRQFITRSPLAWELGLARVQKSHFVEPGDQAPQVRREYQEHSWVTLLKNVGRKLRSARDMHWWTYSSYRKAREVGIAECPTCGSKNLCED